MTAEAFAVGCGRGPWFVRCATDKMKPPLAGGGQPHQLINQVAQVAFVHPVHVFYFGFEAGRPTLLNKQRLHA
jgi:hypothetical protein